MIEVTEIFRNLQSADPSIPLFFCLVTKKWAHNLIHTCWIFLHRLFRSCSNFALDYIAPHSPTVLCVLKTILLVSQNRGLSKSSDRFLLNHGDLSKHSCIAYHADERDNIILITIEWIQTQIRKPNMNRRSHRPKSALTVRGPLRY